MANPRFEQGTERDGFKKALMKAFTSAHKAFAGGPHRTTTPPMPTAGFNRDTRTGPAPGGNQAFQMPSSDHGSQVLGGGTHSSPAQTAQGPQGHNNDRRRTGLMTDGHQADRIRMGTDGLNRDTRHTSFEPTGHQAKKIKMPAGQHVDARGLRNR